jgi:type IV secretory pathway VirB10-like protein
MRPTNSMLRPAGLALAGALAWTLAGCQRETRTVERTPPPPPQASEVARAVPVPPPPVAQAPEAPAAPGPADRRAAELGQNPRTVVIPPETPPPDTGLAARERRLAARQAELDRRERRLRQREQRRSEPSSAPLAAPAPAASEPAAPAPEPAPEPRAVAVTVPAGTTLDIELSKTLSSATSRVGDTFRARVVGDVYDPDGAVSIPAGAEIVGEVSQAVPLDKRIGGQASLGLRFTDLILPSGETVPIQASLQRTGRNESRRDAAAIGGATAGGAILGNILNRGDRGKGSVIGALIGAAVGTAIAARTKGEEVEMPQGAVVRLLLDQDVRLQRRE